MEESIWGALERLKVYDRNCKLSLECACMLRVTLSPLNCTKNISPYSDGSTNVMALHRPWSRVSTPKWSLPWLRLK